MLTNSPVSIIESQVSDCDVTPLNISNTMICQSVCFNAEFFIMFQNRARSQFISSVLVRL